MEVALPSTPLLSFSRPTSYSASSTTTKLPGQNSRSLQYSLSLRPKRRRDWLFPPEHRTAASYRYSSWGRFTEEEEEEEEYCSFEEAVELFNRREYYKCHDVLEALWNTSPEPSRTLLHAILQCAVAFYHLFNHNHKGAMMELGEGVCKLRKMNFENGPFHQFEKEMSAVLDFIHQTQLELAACTEELCLTMDQSERSYQLLGGYAAGESVYRIDKDQDNFTCILFCPEIFHGRSEIFSTSIKLPILMASENHLTKFQSNY